MPDPTPSSSSIDSQRKIAQTLGIPVIRRHIFLCCDQTKPECCEKARGIAAWEYLKRRLRELGLSEQGGIARTKANCLRICEGGPIALVYPEGHLVTPMRSAGPRTHHSGTPHRRKNRGGIYDRAATTNPIAQE